MSKNKPKRDFIFIDESGDPGTFSDYYIQGLIHITDKSLKNINIHLSALRYFGATGKELKSTTLDPRKQEQLLNILRMSVFDNDFSQASAICVNKEDYYGPYLEEKPDHPKDANRFRHFMIRRLLESHFKNCELQSNELELIIDRFYTNEDQERKLRKYLRIDPDNKLPQILLINQADSRYVDLLQLSDWISGAVKEKFFTKPEKDFDDLFDYIDTQKITH
ncbi:MAG: DUF3800 domain-containing protein [Candidatus Magasanikbacteria bacterium]